MAEVKGIGYRVVGTIKSVKGHCNAGTRWAAAGAQRAQYSRDVLLASRRFHLALPVRDGFPVSGAGRKWWSSNAWTVRMW
jgi:hypothetical protein